MKRTFNLKTMALARLLSEVTVLFVFLLLPVATIVVPPLQHWPLMFKLASYILGVLSLCLLPLYGFVPVQVKLDENGLSTHALLKKQFIEWSKITKLRLKSNWNSRQYAVQFQGGEITFPVWLQAQDELLRMIREHLPASTQERRVQNIYSQPVFALATQWAQIVLMSGFIGLLWFFYATTGRSHQIQPEDSLLILIVCVVITLVLGWRSLIVATMPRYVELTDSEIILRTIFFEQRVPWSDVSQLILPFFLLPEGIVLKTKQGLVLLSDTLGDADELKQELARRLPQSSQDVKDLRE